ncbi:MAG: hypothetical protein U0872_01010 [Planctomycetaceae bacterium]
MNRRDAGQQENHPRSCDAQPSPSSVWEAGFRRRIQRTCTVFGIIGFALGVLFLSLSAEQILKGEIRLRMLAAPLYLGAGGMVFGVPVSCLFLPTSYLSSPAGQEWLEVIGTKSILAVRIVCFIFTLILLGLASLLIWAAWMDNFAAVPGNSAVSR